MDTKKVLLIAAIVIVVIIAIFVVTQATHDEPKEDDSQTAGTGAVGYDDVQTADTCEPGTPGCRP
jgi:hypothetical protein